MESALVEGREGPAIFKFAVPILLGNLLQNLYGFVDAAVVGQILGMDALAAVGATGGISFMVLGFCTGISNGFSAVLAKYYGSRDYEGFYAIMKHIIVIASTAAGLMLLIMPTNCMAMLKFFETPEVLLHQSYSYMVILLLGIPITLFYNIIAGFIYAIGDSKTPLLVLFTTSVLHIFFSSCFVLVFHTGVEGAAYGTVFSQLLAGMLCFFLSRKKLPRHTVPMRTVKIQRNMLEDLCKNGFSMGFQTAITGIGLLILQKSINQLGTAAVAALTTGGKIISIFFCVFDSLGSTLATFAGQNIGAKKPERIKRGVKICVGFAFCYYLFVVLMIFLGGRGMLRIFMAEEEIEIVGLAYLHMRISAVSGVFVVVLNLLRFTVQGAGFAQKAIFAGVTELFARVFVALWAIPRLGFLGSCFGHPVAWCVASSYVLIVYTRLSRKDFYITPAVCRKNVSVNSSPGLRRVEKSATTSQKAEFLP